MYFFGYGDFLSTIGTLGLTVNRHFGIRAGYQLAQRFNINNRSNRIGFNLTQGGAGCRIRVFVLGEHHRTSL